MTNKQIDRAVVIKKRKKRKAAKKAQKAREWKKFFQSSQKELKKLKEAINSNKTLFCIDTEDFEHNKELLEIGISIYKDNEIKTYHFIVAENYDLRNEKYVPDHKEDFDFGDSFVFAVEDIEREIKKLYSKDCFLVGHSVHNDMDFLKKIKSHHFAGTFDTQILQKHINQTREDISLSNLCNSFNIETKHLHNAGNDAHYTLMCLLEMANLEILKK